MPAICHKYHPWVDKCIGLPCERRRSRTSIVQAKDSGCHRAPGSSILPNTTAIMLDNLRKHASSWLAKILIALLIIELRGVGRRRSDSPAAMSRCSPASRDKKSRWSEFRQHLPARDQRLSRQRGERITAQQAREAGLPDMVLEQLVNAALLDAHARRLGLSVDDETVTRRITESARVPGFGRQFRAARVSSNRRCASPISPRRRLLAQERSAADPRSSLSRPFGLTAEVPDTLLSAMNRYRNETRVIAHFTVGRKLRRRAHPDPSESALREYYENNSGCLPRAGDPRSRRARVDAASPRGPRQCDREEDVRADYEARRDQYNVPERRKSARSCSRTWRPRGKAMRRWNPARTSWMSPKQQGMSEDDTRTSAH